MDEQRLWGIPLWTVWIAFVVVALFLVIAFCLYSSFHDGNTGGSKYALKVADALITGAIVGVFFAVVKAIFDLPKYFSGK